ncbi:alpha/beta hydrolase [Candidatus Thorarchaeota archaeon]|nr:MAG: alpha/beta hydrolase [Candidatus Thorarchaeota archaeon]
MKYHENQYIGYDGTRMHLPVWTTNNESARAVIIAVHGLSSHGQNLRNIGEYFAERGFVVFAPDMRGFGHYPGRKGHIVKFSEYIEDLQNVVMQVRDQYSRHLVFPFGHSLGGLIVILYAAEYGKSIDGMMLSCPAVSQTLDIGIGKRIAGEILSILNIKRYIDTDLDLEYLSHDPEVVKHHENDPLRFDKVTPRMGIECLRGVDRANRLAPKITVPSLIQQAGYDKLVDPEKTREFYERLGSPDKTWFSYEDFYHELHTEIGKERVLQDMEDWLEKRLPS